MTRILVPKTPLSTRGNWSVSALPAVPPTINSCFVRSSNLLIGVVCQAAQMLTSSLALPIQLNFVASNWAPLRPSSGSNGTPRPMMPNVEFFDSPYRAAAGADAVVLVTEWDVLRALDLKRLAREMGQPVFVDLRSVYPPEDVEQAGLRWFGIGRSLRY